MFFHNFTKCPIARRIFSNLETVFLTKDGSSTILESLLKEIVEANIDRMILRHYFFDALKFFWLGKKTSDNDDEYGKLSKVY